MSTTTGIGIGSRLFLTAAPGLGTGSELSPGHWMRQVEDWSLARHSPEGAPIWEPYVLPTLLELACETVRLREFPHLPSRLNCLFLWAEEGLARAWHYRKHVLQGSDAGLYEGEVVTCRRAVAADHNLVSYLAGETLGSLLEQARCYWRAEGGGPQEVLLEGSVVIRRDLLALPRESLKAVKNPGIDRAMYASIRWHDADERHWNLTLVRASRYHIEGVLVAEAHLPMTAAGWIALEVEEQREMILARRGTPPLLVRPGEPCRVDAQLVDVPPLSTGARYRPVLLCDRAAAHYWQLQPYWEGSLRGEWRVVTSSEQQ